MKIKIQLVCVKEIDTEVESIQDYINDPGYLYDTCDKMEVVEVA